MIVLCWMVPSCPEGNGLAFLSMESEERLGMHDFDIGQMSCNVL